VVDAMRSGAPTVTRRHCQIASGWHRFTDRVLAAVNARQIPAACILWGNAAREKAAMLNAGRHFVHESEHPSPLATYRGFFGGSVGTRAKPDDLRCRARLAYAA
jgi:uracil-DNA glycosylase